MTGPANPPCVTFSEMVEGRPVVVSTNRDDPATLSIRFDGETIGGIPVAAARAIVWGIRVVETEISLRANGSEL
jgi:hypothetical protein